MDPHKNSDWLFDPKHPWRFRIFIAICVLIGLLSVAYGVARDLRIWGLI